MNSASSQDSLKLKNIRILRCINFNDIDESKCENEFYYDNIYNNIYNNNKTSDKSKVPNSNNLNYNKMPKKYKE